MSLVELRRSHLCLKNVKCTLKGRGKHRSFRRIDDGSRLRGLTKALLNKLYSTGTPPSTLKSDLGRFSGRAWRGNGFRRGRAVDAQISRLVNSKKGLLTSSETGSYRYKLSRLFASFCQKHGIVPLKSQVPCCIGAIGTAADVICAHPASGRTVVVEVKTGFREGLIDSYHSEGRPMHFKGFVHVADTTLNRHLAQIAATTHMLCMNGVLDKEFTSAVLVYLRNDELVSVDVDDWWLRRARDLLRAVS
jgi:hypothetical protein